MQKFQRQTLTFADFTLDLTRGCLMRGEQEIKLRPKSFEVLRYLVENGGRLVSKDELIEAVWPGTAVTDDSLVQCLIEVRRALGDKEQHLIKTVPRRGYLLDAEVIRHDSAVRELIYTEDVEGVRVKIEEEANDQYPVLTSSGAIDLKSAVDLKLLPGATKRSRLTPATFLILALFAAAIITAAYFVIPRYFGSDKARITTTGNPGTIRSIAVLPFTNTSGNPDTEYVSDGISESLINSLSQLPGLRVIGRSSSFKYKGKEVDPQEVANALGVEGVMTGRVSQRGDELWISVELVDARDKRQVWGDQYNRRASDVLAVLSEISGEIAENLRLRLTPGDQQQLAKTYTSNPRAYDYYAKAMYHFRNIGPGLNTRSESNLAVDLLKKAIELDPKYALARAQLGYVYVRIAVFQEDSPALIEHAKQELAAAERLDPKLAQVHTARYFIAFSQYEDWQVETAIRELRLAQQLDPNVGHSELGDLFVHIGLEKQAAAEYEIALKIDPDDDEIKRSEINEYFITARPDEGLEANRRLFNRGPGLMYYMEKRMLNEAAPLIEEASQKHSNTVEAWEAIKYQTLWPALHGKHSEAQAAIPSILKKARRNRGYHHLTYDIARTYALGGKSEEAVKWLRVTVQEGFPCYPLFARDSYLDVIRNEPAFIQFLAEMKTRWEGYQREFG